MVYQDYDMKMIPPDCSECDLANESGWCLAYGCMPVYGDQYNKTRNEHCPLKSGSVMEWVDVRDRLPDFTGPVLVTMWDKIQTVFPGSGDRDRMDAIPGDV